LVTTASLTLVARLGAFGFSLITNVILARSLGVQGRGVYAVAVMVSTIIALLVQLGIGPANVYHLSKKLIDLDELVGHSTSLALLLGTLSFLIVLAYVELTGSGEFLGIGSEFVLVACAALPFILLTVYLQGVLQGAQRFVLFNALLLAQYAAPAVTLAFAVFVLHGHTLGAVAAWTASAALTAAVAVYCVSTLSRFSIRLHGDTIRPLLRFGLISYLGNLTSFVNYRFDVLLVNFFAGARQVGLYAVGTGLAEIVWYISNAASTVLAPRVAAADDGEEADRLTEAVARVVGFLALVSAALLAIFAPFIVVFFFGAAFAESAWAVWLLLPGIITFSVGRIFSMYLLGRNRLKVDLLAASVGLVLTVALDVLLIPRFGFRGAAVASSIAYTAAMLVDLVWILRNSTITPSAALIVRKQDLRTLWTRSKELLVSLPLRRG
jgi:O-antigen/teichoic acid export membrane protein